MTIIPNKFFVGMYAALCISTLSAYDQAFNDQAIKSYLNCYASLEKQSEKEANLGDINFANPNDIIKWLFKGKPLNNPSPTQRERLEIAYTIFESSQNNEQLIDQNFINKLAFMYDEKTNNTTSLIHGLIGKTASSDLCLTTFGEYRFFELLTQPTNNIAILKQRQELLQQLLADTKLLKHAQQLLKIIKDNEHFLLEFYRTKDDFKDKMYKDVYFGTFLNHLNQSPTALGFTTRFGQLFAAFNLGFLPWMFYKECGLVRTAYQKLGIPAGLTNTVVYTLGTFFSGLYAYTSTLTVAQQKLRATIISFLQTQMIGVAKVMKAIQELHDLFNKNEQIKNCFKTCKHLDLDTIKNDQTNDLIELLNTNTFTGQASIFSSPGNILTAYKLMDDESVKKSLQNSLRALGELDAFVNLAEKINALADKSNHFTFTTFVDKQTPCIKTVNMWNPFISPDKAIGNDLQLGDEQRQNLIITGPNKGGKSTFMKTIILNLWLSHTFGIAAGNSFETTLFAYLGCHLNEQEAIGHVSHFQAQAVRAKELLNRLRAVPAQQYSFILLDEMFSGTSPEQEVKESMNFLRMLCGMPNCVFVDATHHYQLTNLEQETTSCRNVHMEALTDDQGTVIKYTYKLVPGISNVKNADQVIKDEGIDWNN